MEETLVTPAAQAAATPADTVASAAQESAVTPEQAQQAVATAAKEADQAEETLLGKEEKKEEAPAVAKVVPEKYEFKVPEGMTIDAGLVEKVTPVFKEIGLSQEQAQKMVDAYAPYVKSQMESQQKALSDGYKKIVDDWKVETQKELGADSKAKLAIAAKAINRFGTPKLREVLNETGLGNHKEVVNLLIKVGTLLGEDHFVEPNKQGTGTSQEAFLRKHYPTMVEN